MTKMLTLKPRGYREGRPNWHDLFVLQAAISTIAQGKNITKAMLWLNIAGKLQYAQEENELRQDNLDQEVTIELRNVEARVLWKELCKLRPEGFSRDMRGQPASPPLGVLHQMLCDFAEQLGVLMPEVELDDDEN